MLRLCKAGALLTALEMTSAMEQGGILDLRNNIIEVLEEERRLSDLRGLLLGRNILKRAEFTPCFQNLEFLDLSDNKLQSLELGLLRRLQFLDLAGASRHFYASLDNGS